MGESDHIREWMRVVLTGQAGARLAPQEVRLIERIRALKPPCQASPQTSESWMVDSSAGPVRVNVMLAGGLRVCFIVRRSVYCGPLN